GGPGIGRNRGSRGKRERKPRSSLALVETGLDVREIEQSPDGRGQIEEGNGYAAVSATGGLLQRHQGAKAAAIHVDRLREIHNDIPHVIGQRLADLVAKRVAICQAQLLDVADPQRASLTVYFHSLPQQNPSPRHRRFNGLVPTSPVQQQIAPEDLEVFLVARVPTRQLIAPVYGRAGGGRVAQFAHQERVRDNDAGLGVPV